MADPLAPMDMSFPEEQELADRVPEMSPHQRALNAVVKLWTTLTYPAAVGAALVVGTAVAWSGPGSVNALVLLGTYFFIAVPGTLLGVTLQTRARRWLAKKILRDLDAGAQGAISGISTPAGFLGTRSSSEPVPRLAPPRETAPVDDEADVTVPNPRALVSSVEPGD